MYLRILFLDTSDIFDEDGNPLTTGFNTLISQDQLNWFCNKALNFMDKEDKEENKEGILSLEKNAHELLSSNGKTICRILRKSYPYIDWPHYE